MKEALIEASKELAAAFNFILVENAGNDGALDYFGLKAPDTPALVIHDQTKDAKFVSKNVGAEALLPWLEEFKVRGTGTVIRARGCYPQHQGVVCCCQNQGSGAGACTPGGPPGWWAARSD